MRGSGVVDIEQREARRHAQQRRFDNSRSPQERNRLGQYATPPTLAKEIAAFVYQLLRRRKGPFRFLEPAVGSGCFYSAVRQAFPPAQIVSATGFELDRSLAGMAAQLWGCTGLSVRRADFTQQPPPDRQGRYDLLLTNPPYVRHHHLSPDVKRHLHARVQQQLGLSVSGLAGLYCYFVLLADHWLAPRGLAAWLIPAEFMDVNYGQVLRQYVTEHVTLRRIHCFCPNEVQFQDALVSSAVLIYEKRKPPTGHQTPISCGMSLCRPDRMGNVPVGQLKQLRTWSAVRAGRMAMPAPTAGSTLGDLFVIQRGLATGANRFFILPRQEAMERGIPDRFQRPILPGPRNVPGRIIHADLQGIPLLPRRLVLIDCPCPEDVVQREFPQLWNYFQAGRARKLHLRYLTSRRRPWYAQEHRPPAPFLCTYMGRGSAKRRPFRFLWNKSQATAANVYLMLYPQPPLADFLAEHPQSWPAVYQTLQAMESQFLLWESRSYGGGLRKLEPSELKRLPAGVFHGFL